ncbi:MAG: histidine ammonia-lyase [Chloroflexota bacterium]
MTTEPPHKQTHPLALGDRHLTPGDVEDVGRRMRPVEISAGGIAAIEKSHRHFTQMLESNRPIYGANTGFGALATRRIPAADLESLQVNLLHSHAAGAGSMLPEDVVRSAMLLRAGSLTRGFSGVRVELVGQIISLLNAGIYPCVPEQGSLGASGDLAPLAHMALALVGEGEVRLEGEVLPAGQALKRRGIEPLTLEPKEALALINGTPFLTAIAVLALLDAERLLCSAVGVSALSAFAIAARQEPFDARLQRARPHPDQVRVASLIRELLGPQADTGRIATRLQDPYSVRCVPQVYGAVSNSLSHLRGSLEIEVNSATDNPLIFEDHDDPISGGNFHGHPVALPVEGAKVAIASLGTMIERRINLLVDGEEYGIPQFLVAEPGLNSGYMIAHYLSAGLVAENRVLAHPSAADSIPTSANIEDYNSMGMTASRHFRSIVENVEKIVAVEALCAAQAVDLRDLKPRGALGEVYAAIRKAVPMLESDDRIIASDIESARTVIRGGEIASIVESIEEEPS